MRVKFLLIFIFTGAVACGQGFLKASGTRIVNDRNEEVIFRGMGLGGWMLQEPYMLKLSGTVMAQHEIRKKITDLVGEKNTNEFYEAWLSNHCTKADIDSMAAWGFNSVRLPMHYNLFTLPVEKEPVKGKNTWLKKGFALTDSLLSWCKANKIYLILDLHAAPGGQGNDNAIADRDTNRLSLWQDERNRKKTITLWEKLAARYANEEWIGAYDIINEPNWGFESAMDRNGCEEKKNIPLRKLMEDITKAIRKKDKRHIIIVEGNCWGNNYDGVFPLWDDNMMVSFHKYWNFNNTGSIKKFLDIRQQYNVPVWLGETGENSNAWFTDVLSLLDEHGIGWNMWPWKKSGINNPLQVPVNKGVEQVFQYWRGKAPKPDAAMAKESLMEFARNTNIRGNIIHRGVIDALTRQVKNTEAKPFDEPVIVPGKIIYATNYDLGRSGASYHDKDSAEYWVSTSTRTPWNTGGQYRNDGVDIEACTDAISNGYNVGWIEPGEWLQYSLYLKEEGIFDLNIRSASKEREGAVKIIINDKALPGTVVLPRTGETQSWTTSTLKNLKFNKGWNRLRVVAENGGFNLNYFQFMSPEPITQTD